MTRLPRPAGHGQDPAGPAAGRRAAPGPAGSLYPFISGTAVDPAQVLAEARESAIAKAREIIALRTAVCARSAGLLASCAHAMAGRFAAGGRLLVFGNGGSATDAGDLATLFIYPPDGSPSLPALNLAGDTSVLTALANDIGVEVIFARQLAAFGRTEDIAVGLSTSGNSENLLRAFGESRRLGMMTVGIAGYDGGKMAELSSLDYLFIAPSESVHRIQEAQTTIYHVLWELVIAGLGASHGDHLAAGT